LNFYEFQKDAGFAPHVVILAKAAFICTYLFQPFFKATKTQYLPTKLVIPAKAGSGLSKVSNGG
jgi:hypothetical protein